MRLADAAAHRHAKPSSAPRASEPEMPDAETCWRAVAARDRTLRGAFVFAVASTGIYCAPGCPARTPARRNVRFFAAPAAAEAAGFRPCLRCRPDRPQADVAAAAVQAAIAAIDSAGASPPLAELARLAGYSPHHFHRLFRQATGLTPRAFGAAVRARRLRGTLRAGEGVAPALYAAGYGAPSRAYEGAAATLGMTPAAYARGAAGERIGYAIGRSALGPMLVAATARGVCAIQFADDAAALVAALRADFPKAELVEDAAALAPLIAEVGAAVSDPARAAAIPLDIRGTAFQRRVWQALRAIPAGQKQSYAAVAAAIGAPASMRAVARACAANRIALAVPCHRVVRADGAAGGYRWGEARKRLLLAGEAVQVGLAAEPGTSPGRRPARPATRRPRS